MSTATAYARRNQNLYRTTTKIQLGPISVGFVTIAIIAVLSLIYLTQITKTSVYGYQMSELTQKQQKLQMAKQEAEVEAARLQSINNIQSSEAVKRMVNEQNVSYAQSK